MISLAVSKRCLRIEINSVKDGRALFEAVTLRFVAFWMGVEVRVPRPASGLHVRVWGPTNGICIDSKPHPGIINYILQYFGKILAVHGCLSGDRCFVINIFFFAHFRFKCFYCQSVTIFFFIHFLQIKRGAGRERITPGGLRIGATRRLQTSAAVVRTGVAISYHFYNPIRVFLLA